MALSHHEEQVFQTLIRDLEGPRRESRPHRWLWILLTLLCFAVVLLAGALDAPWLAVVGWPGLIASSLRTAYHRGS